MATGSWNDDTELNKVNRAFVKTGDFEWVWEIADFNDNHPHEEVIALWERVGREQGWISP